MSKGITNRLFKGDKVTWIIFAALFALSFVEVFSATSRLTFRSESYWYPITMHVRFMAMGFVAAWITHNFPMSWFKKLAYIAYWGGLALLVYATFFGQTKNDASRWVTIMGFSIQASEFAKLGLIMMVANFLGDWQSDLETGARTMGKILIATGLVCGLTFTTNLSTTLLVCFIIYLMMLLGKLPRALMLKFTGICILAGGLLGATIMMIPPSSVKDTKLERVITWQNRVKDFLPFFKSEAEKKKSDDGKSDQRVHANIAIASSGIIFGKGPGNSVQRDFLPEAYSDLIYAIIIEEWGLIIGCIGVLLLYLTLLYHTGQIAKNCDDPFATYLALGAALMIGTHALFHMTISVGLGPITGQPLPLVSRGGSSIIVNCIYIGMILSISRYARELRIAKERAKHNKTDKAEIKPMVEAATEEP